MSRDAERRLHDIFAKYVAEGRAIVIEFADVEPFEVNGVRLGRDTIGDRFKRRAIQHRLGLSAEPNQGPEVPCFHKYMCTDFGVFKTPEALFPQQPTVNQK